MTDDAETDTYPYRIGRVARPHGLKGDVVLQLFRRRGFGAHGEDHRLQRLDPPWSAEVEREDGRVDEVQVTHARWLDPIRLILRLRGVADRTAAEGLVGVYFDAHPDQLPEWIADPVDACFEARAVHAESGEALGEVVAIRDNGAQALLEIELVDGALALVPFVAEMVVEVGVDEKGRFVRVQPLPGLLEVNR